MLTFNIISNLKYLSLEDNPVLDKRRPLAEIINGDKYDGEQLRV